MDYQIIANTETISKTEANLKEHGFNSMIVETGAEALAKIKEMIPPGASVVNGTSQTLEQIGYIDYLKLGTHGWNNLKDGILKETDPVKQSLLRKQSVLADYYLGSAHAVTETGELLFASGTGSQLPSLSFTSSNVILVVGAHKIVPTLAEAFNRLETYVFPLEDARMKSTGAKGASISKILILKKEPDYLKINFTIIFVKEKLGF